MLGVGEGEGSRRPLSDPGRSLSVTAVSFSGLAELPTWVASEQEGAWTCCSGTGWAVQEPSLHGMLSVSDLFHVPVREMKVKHL